MVRSLSLMLGFFILCTGGVKAQSLQRYLSLSLGTDIVNLQDDGMSPFIYGGSLFRAGLEFNRNKIHSLSSIEISFSQGGLNRSEDFELSEADAYRFQFRYHYLRSFLEGSESDWNFYLGGEINYLGDVRLAYQLDNALVNYLSLLSIGPKFQTSRTFSFDERRVHFNAFVSLPLLNHIMRPDYLNRINFPNPEWDILSDNFERSGFQTVNNVFRLIIGADCQWEIQNGNRFSLGYQWDVQDIRSSKSSVYAMTAAAHQITFKCHIAY